MKISIELTTFQHRQIQTLSRALWPNESLEDREVCRRLCLIGADGIANGQCRSWVHLLENAHLPVIPSAMV